MDYALKLAIMNDLFSSLLAKKFAEELLAQLESDRKEKLLIRNAKVAKSKIIRKYSIVLKDANRFTTVTDALLLS